MSDSIDRLAGLNATRTTERIAGSNPSGLRLKQDGPAANPHDDQVDIHPAWRVQNGAGELTLSLAIIRALLADELPKDVVDALKAYASFGELENASFWCDRIEQKGQDHVMWFSTMTLAQTLERMAR